MVMLGSGSAKYEAAMRAAEAAHRPSFRGWVGFSVPLAHRILAACDVLLMPSRFEPCGLNQLFAMRYGTVPIAHATGGLRDTIASYDPDAAGAAPERRRGPTLTLSHLFCAAGGSAVCYSQGEVPCCELQLRGCLHV